MEEQPKALILDPASEFVEEQRVALVDFIFRLSGDRSRASVQAREVTNQIKDELSSQLNFEKIRAALFQRAYELNEESLHPIARDYLEHYFRNEHKDFGSMAKLFAWELKLQKLGQHAAMLLLLQHRYSFSLELCSQILGRELSAVTSDSETLAKLLKRRPAFDCQLLKQLPQYGYLPEVLPPPTALSRVLRELRPPVRIAHSVWFFAVFLGCVLLGLWQAERLQAWLQLLGAWLKTLKDGWMS